MPDNEEMTQVDVVPTEPDGELTALDEKAPTSLPASTPPTIDWDSPENPHKYASEQMANTLTRLNEAVQQAGIHQEVQDLRTQGVSDADIEKHLALRQREAATAQRETLVQEAARIEVARRLSQEFIAKGLNISQDELLVDSRGHPIQQPIAMAARADALAQERSKTTRAARVSTGADATPNTEQGGGGGHITNWAQAVNIKNINDLSDADFEKLIS